MAVCNIVSRAGLNHRHQELATIVWRKGQETGDQETLQEIHASLIVAVLIDQAIYRGTEFLIIASPGPIPVVMIRAATELTSPTGTAQNQAGETKSSCQRVLD